MGGWFSDNEKNERVNYNTPLPWCDTLNEQKSRGSARVHSWLAERHGACAPCTRVRTLVRQRARPRNTDGRTGWRTTGRPGQPSGDSRDTASHSPTYSTRIRTLLHLMPLFLFLRSSRPLLVFHRYFPLILLLRSFFVSLLFFHTRILTFSIVSLFSAVIS